MTEQITPADLHAIFNGLYDKDKILSAIAKHFKSSVDEIKTYTSIKWYYRSYSVFLLHYFGVTFRDIVKEFHISQPTASAEIRAISRHFFLNKDTTDLFLFVLAELRNTQRHD
jgi:hypothetical protein